MGMLELVKIYISCQELGLSKAINSLSFDNVYLKHKKNTYKLY